MDPKLKESLKKAWQIRKIQRQQEEKERQRKALERALSAARYLKEHYGVHKVHLYGSLLWGRRFTAHSDIDLMVSGFPPTASFWRMLVELEEIASPFELNVVLEEDALPLLREKVLKEGKEL